MSTAIDHFTDLADRVRVISKVWQELDTSEPLPMKLSITLADTEDGITLDVHCSKARDLPQNISGHARMLFTRATLGTDDLVQRFGDAMKQVVENAPEALINRDILHIALVPRAHEEISTTVISSGLLDTFRTTGAAKSIEAISRLIDILKWRSGALARLRAAGPAQVIHKGTHQWDISFTHPVLDHPSGNHAEYPAAAHSAEEAVVNAISNAAFHLGAPVRNLRTSSKLRSVRMNGHEIPDLPAFRCRIAEFMRGPQT